jgi:hypothetical protein
VRCCEAHISPPRPAVADDSMNTPSFSRVMFIPSVAHAAGLSFMAIIIRPYALRRIRTRAMPMSANIAVINMRKARWLRKSTPNQRGRGTVSDPEVKRLIVKSCPKIEPCSGWVCRITNW